jgi:hypothetical protein
MADLPELTPKRRLTESERVAIGETLRGWYEDGMSIREICAQTGYSIGRVRRLLVRAGVSFRRRGGSRRSPDPD